MTNSTYTTEDFKQDVNKLRELIDKCEQLERQNTEADLAQQNFDKIPYQIYVG